MQDFPIHYIEVPEENPLARVNRSWWAVVNLCILSFGIFVQGWTFMTLIYVFWMEIIFTVACYMVRVVGAFDKLRYYTLSWERFNTFLFAGAAGTACITFIVTLTFDLFHGDIYIGMPGYPKYPIILLGINHVFFLISHFFILGGYKRANPFREFSKSYYYLVFIVGAEMAIVLHYLPLYPTFANATELALKLVGARFALDLVYSGFLYTVYKMIFPDDDYSQPVSLDTSDDDV